ncbi:MAG: flavodoxin family protein, partial [Methanosarcinales archaeon]|nr:flavodoxin family protein [Methanosarcinales archaeon]
MKIIGISGSPIEDSNTDTLIKEILDATGAENEFVKLSAIDVAPCIACMKCVYTNKCIINDDFKWLSKKVLQADAIVIGSPTYYGAASA